MWPYWTTFHNYQFLGCDDILRIQNLYGGGEMTPREKKIYWPLVESLNLIMERTPVWSLFWYPKHSDIDPWHPHEGIRALKCNNI